MKASIAIALSLTACMSLDEPEDGDVEMVDIEVTEADAAPPEDLALATYHTHYIDWKNGARLGLCSSGKKLIYGVQVKMSSTPGRNCNGHYYVWVVLPGQPPELGNYIRINALNGH